MTRRSTQSKLSAGFTLIELMIAVSIIAILASMAVPLYQNTLATSENTASCADLRNIAMAIDFYILANGFPPDSLADVGMDSMRDAWGNPYQYLRLDGGANDNGNGDANANAGGKGNANNNGNAGNGGNAGGVGAARKDHNLVPINSDYDLYSMGPDGKSASPLTAAISRDDIIRAQNGNFFGLASEY